MNGIPTRTLLATALALIAFASNSILCRLALGAPDIDAVGFTAIRLGSGAVTLLFLAKLSRRERTPESAGNWISAAALFGYAILFSFAYLDLDTGVGALILFTCVQATMVLWGLVRGERPRPRQWLGWLAAIGGLVYLLSPGLSAPSPTGALMMAGAGISWGVYSLRGRDTPDPVVTTADNFVRTVPMVLIVVAILFRTLDVTGRGALIAVASGALASGVGYVIWYAALRGLSATRAASVQLPVPVLTAIGGIAFLGEAASLRLALASLLILGGVALTLAGREMPARR